ncbi:DUF6339 family protein [Thioalkalivibrio sp. HK1]|uniref:DUF6339 family protein n=1 Tax=Thioalkalivibrio sp. HK1 TaxID=1469245 RepID=UPI000471C9DA|nr:DUF6339 family protein [Thioalkalivibrio sp. HK1]
MMKLPSINRETANDVWNSMRHHEEYDPSKISLEYIGSDDWSCFSDVEIQEMLESLDRIKMRYKGGNIKFKGGDIDSDVVEPVHRALSEHATAFQLSQIEFWMWLSNVAVNGGLWNFLYWRFSGSDQLVNWGITTPKNLKEVYFYRAWLRGHRMYDPSLDDPYHYAKLGSGDVWRSHILRQEFGSDREFVKAFLDTIYNESGKDVIGTDDLRAQLIPEIREWTSSASFSHLSYEENKELLAYLWEKARAEALAKIDKG